MMSPYTLVAIIICYVAVLYLIATWGSSESKLAKKVSSSAFVYILSIAVYCTSWTFYGSVGLASRAGILVYCVYMGPTILLFMMWPMLRRILRVKQAYHVNSIADFISARFNQSFALAGLASVVAMVGIVPYLALQLKAINTSFGIMIGDTSYGSGFTWVIWAGVAIFTIAFGVRHVDPTERHPGMMLALATESLVKLIAMLLVGIFVCFIMFDDPASIFSQLVQLKPEQAQAITNMPNPVTWISFLILSASAFFMLPRQFHVMVVENSEPSYIKKAQWLLPIYLFLITIFVIPIASAGALVIGPEKPDMYMLTLPQSDKQLALSVIVFVGGFSASMAMLMVSGMTLSNMFSNHLALPTLRKLYPRRDFGQYLLQIRWLGVFLVLAAGQSFYLFLGETYLLVNIGLISFCAVLQFLPIILAGLYWDKVNSKGALMGLSAGFIMWAYTMLLPAITKIGLTHCQRA